MINVDNNLMTGTTTIINRDLYIEALRNAIEWYNERANISRKELADIQPSFFDLLFFNRFLRKQLKMYKQDVIDYHSTASECRSTLLYLQCLDADKVSIDLNTFSFLYRFINGKGL